MIQVVNKYKHSPTKDDVYIGRGSLFGNPYTFRPTLRPQGTVAVATREEAVEKYKPWFESQLKNPTFAAEVEKLKCKAVMGNLNLVCYCAPKVCHGDVIKKFIGSIT